MKKIEIYDPAMCCSSGVCGPCVTQNSFDFDYDYNSIVYFPRRRNRQLKKIFETLEYYLRFVKHKPAGQFEVAPLK